MIRIILFTVFIGIVLFTVSYLQINIPIHPAKWSMLIFFAIVSLAQHYLIMQSFEDNRQNFVQMFLGSVVMRLLVCSAYVGAFFYKGIEQPVLYIITFFVLYLFFTCFEIYGINRKLRQN
jgi:hypothetical protein